jgi:putative ABC transport system permease protein
MLSTETVIRDLRDAVRGIRQRPGFTALAVLTLTLGIAVNGAAITTAFGILVRPLPYESPERIVVVNLLFPDGGDLGFSPDAAGEWLRRLDGVEAAAAYYTRDVTIRAGSRSTVERAAFVTDGFFDVFGARPESGHARLSTDEQTLCIAHGRVAEVLGGNAADAVGTGVTVGATPRTVAAVLPSEFAFPGEQIGVWLPSRVPPLEAGYSKIVARLRPGVTLAQFRDGAGRVARELKSDRGNPISVTPLGESIVGGMRRLLMAAVVGSLLLLAVACANVATLFIGRDLGRRREFATRLALGARRADLVRGVLTEALVFSLVAAVAGLLLGSAALTWFTRAAASEFPRLIHVRMDAAAGAAFFGLIMAAAFLSGTVPAWHAARGDFSGFLKPTSSSRPGVWIVRRLLVVAQIACCCMLLIGAGLLWRTVTVLLHEDAGFDPHNALAAKLVLSDVVLAGPERGAFVRSLLDRTRALPGVHAAGLGSNLPPRTPVVEMGFDVETNGHRESRLVKVGSATSGFLPALGARFLAGRDFDEADGGSPVVILSESFARFYFVNRDPVGQTIASLPKMFGLSGAPRVVGVVADMKYDGLDSPVGGAIYLPWSGRPFGTGYLIVRTAADLRRALGDIRRAVAALDPTVPVPELLPLDDVAAQSIAGRSMRAIPAAVFALLALMVAAIGVMATLSALVAERRRDLAIRSALGASRERLMWTIARQGLALTVLGLLAGVAIGAIGARALASLLYGVTPHDAVTFAGSTTLILATSLVMTMLAAVRALRIDPITVLRRDA